MSQQDRDPDSLTYGSFDRNHWHFKMRDFSSAVVQQSALSLALIQVLPLENSPYYRNGRIREWALAGLDFWSRIQLKDGSFNEYYPFEHGYIPTSFSLFAAAEACRTLEVDNGDVINACLKAAAYLSKVEETQALNQEAAAIPGLYATFLLSGEEWVRVAAEKKFNNLLEKQSAEGWFAEYGGADLGYLSTTLDFLVEYQRMSGDPRAFAAAERILEFSQFFIHQDGSVGGQYGSRNTEYFLLSGLSALAAEVPLAAAMLAKLRQKIGTDEFFYAAFDDRYLCHNMMHSLLRAVRNGDPPGQPGGTLPCDREHEQFFPQAGLLSLNKGAYHLICSLKKGGNFRLFAAGKEIFHDYGYRLQVGEGKRAATSWLNQDCQVETGADGYCTSGAFTEVEQQRVTPWRHFLLRLAARLLGRRLIPLLKKRLIFVDRRSRARFERRVRPGPEGVEVQDHIWADRPLARVYPADKFSLRHVASSKYFAMGELSEGETSGWARTRQVRLRRQIRIPGGQVTSAAEVN